MEEGLPFSGFPQSWKVRESHGKIYGHGKSWKSHGKFKKYQKSWKSKNFTPIRVQNIVTDLVLS